jgi:transcriptional regulator with XRE-family HTH domain
MGARDSPFERARRRIADDEARARADIAAARRNSGLSQAAIGRACGLSASAVSRIEAGETNVVQVRHLAVVAAAVGLDVRLRVFPGGDPIRDAGQARLLDRLRVQLHPTLRWQTEVPLPEPRELRTWDAVIRGSRWRLGIEAETVISDVQALERRLNLKRRDGGLDHVVLLVGATVRNRRALAASPAAFGDLRGRPREVLRALRVGRDPGTSAIILL